MPPLSTGAIHDLRSVVAELQLVLQALEALGGKASQRVLEGYFREHFPDRKTSNVGPDATLLTVNAHSRIHHASGK